MKTYFIKNKIEAGCDEAGRGCLSGAVYAAAVILPKDFPQIELNDSKQITENKRKELKIIIEKYAIWSVSKATPQEIDKLNILRASIKAMHRAIENLPQKPQHLIIDGNHFYKYQNIPYQCIIKGDSKYTSIAAASILAKTHRDEYMQKLHEKYPQYAWNKNKGYPTKQHRAAILKHGTTIFHRKSFNLLPKQYKIQFI